MQGNPLAPGVRYTLDRWCIAPSQVLPHMNIANTMSEVEERGKEREGMGGERGREVEKVERGGFRESLCHCLQQSH